MRARVCLFACGWPQEELAEVFEIWDTDKAGSLDYKKIDRAIRGAKGAPQMAKRMHSTAKDIQRALNERLQGRVNTSRIKLEKSKMNVRNHVLTAPTPNPSR